MKVRTYLLNVTVFEINDPVLLSVLFSQTLSMRPNNRVINKASSIRRGGERCRIKMTAINKARERKHAQIYASFQISCIQGTQNTIGSRIILRKYFNRRQIWCIFLKAWGNTKW